VAENASREIIQDFWARDAQTLQTTAFPSYLEHLGEVNCRLLGIGKKHRSVNLQKLQRSVIT